MEYIAYQHKDRKSDFGVSFSRDFSPPRCVTAGKTLEEARRLAGEALACHIAAWRRTATPFRSRPKDDVANDPA